MVDDNNNTLRYSAPQKRTESMARRNNKILLKEKKNNNITNLETKLSEQNSKTINLWPILLIKNTLSFRGLGILIFKLPITYF